MIHKIYELKLKVSCNLDSIQKQYGDMVCKLENDGLNIIEKIPEFQNIKTGLYNERNKVLGAKKLRFTLCDEVIIPEKFKKFLLADYQDDGEGKRIILFCSNKIREQVHGSGVLT